MAVDFRCENCGKLLSVEAEPGQGIKCPHCRKKVSVPEGLASLPRPQVPGAQAKAKSSGAAPPPPPQQPAEEEYLEEEGEDSAVMTTMAGIMPWVISVFLHVGLAVIMLFVVMISVEIAKDKDKLGVVIPDDLFSETPGGRINPGDANPDLKAQQPKPTEKRQHNKRDTNIRQDDGETKNKLNLAGLGGGASGGAMAQLGLQSGGAGKGPKSDFFGFGGNAHHIVYVIDRSGSMLMTFDYVRGEMLRSIGRLQEVQDFHVIMFAAGAPKEHDPRRLVRATREYKLSAARWLQKVKPEGQTNPIPALQRAFDVLGNADKRKGKLIYLLTDGNFPDNAAVLQKVAARNQAKDVHINTFLYGEDRPPAEAVDVMEKIANENNGKYKFVSLDE